MGKKSREKKERRQLGKIAPPSSMLLDMLGVKKQVTGLSQFEKAFQRQITSLKALFCQYKTLDAALALSVSELWPANTGSPIKHIFAWCVLLDSVPNTQKGASIVSYEDFTTFVEKLYAIWPEFPMLEDFSHETDWGQTKIRLGQEFVPVFYGSCIERIPDFIEAFRITYAHIPEAQAHMDLVVALQSRIIESMPILGMTLAEKAPRAHIEVAPEGFWVACASVLKQVGNDIADWRNKSGHTFDVHLGAFKAPLEWDSFGDAVLQGMALPFLAVESDGTWIPMSVRSGPGVVIDYWANSNSAGVSSQTHMQLAQFVAERFQRVLMGPLKIFLGDGVCADLTISCVISADSGVYLICACDHESIDRLSKAATNIFSKLGQGVPVYFRLADGRFLTLSKDNVGLSVEELHIVIVTTLASTAFGSINMPVKPSRLLPLADFITIFDSLNDLGELERYWQFVDAQRDSLSFFSRGAVDLFASFRDTHGVLLEGAISPTFISLDPHWGTSWRFKALTDFWSLAPNVFPDGSAGWNLFPATTGVVKLESRHHKAIAYSTLVASCNVQTIIEVSNRLRIEDARLIDLFAQLLVDCAYRCSELMLDVPLFKHSHVLFSCEVDPLSVAEAEEIQLDDFLHVVTLAKEDDVYKKLFHLRIDSRAVLAGLDKAKDGSFEVRCLVETLKMCHEACGFELPDGFNERFVDIVQEPARYHLRVVPRYVDVPDYVEPVIPSSTEYKLARRHLAKEIMAIGIAPGRYELSDAKAKIDSVSTRVRYHIEERLKSLNRCQLLHMFIEQHDALLVTERIQVQRARQSLAHAVDYDRLNVIEHARKEFGSVARHYRYLLEKTVSSPGLGESEVTDQVLRELVGLVDWYMVLTGASDTLHNGIDVGGVEIDDSYIPEVFYSVGSDDKENLFVREYAKSRLGLGTNAQDVVEGESDDLLSSSKLREAFLIDLGFELQNMVSALIILSQAQRYGFGDELSLSYAASTNSIIQVLADNIDRLSFSEAEKIVAFLTLSETGIRRLSGRDVEEVDVPYWEHNKRTHRYTIRPLVFDGRHLCWGAETASRAKYLWMSAVRDGYLPADFSWPHIEPVIRDVKENIEKRLELRTEEIFLRHTPYVLRGIDFFRRFRREGFEDVGDFDVFAYWPVENLIVTVECKYNQPSYTLKDGRRLRDRIFGKAENDKAGQFSRILRRRKFLEKNHSKLLEVLNWPKSETTALKNVELYVSREMYYWMVHPPYRVPTHFVTVDTLDNWLKTELATLDDHVRKH